jgi:iron-sulfur cluster repair protein YtfE (RIC family)
MNAAMPTQDGLPDGTWTVNEILLHYPDAVRALNAFGVDTCCGGANSLADAARESGVSLDDLLAGVLAVLEAGR